MMGVFLIELFCFAIVINRLQVSFPCWAFCECFAMVINTVPTKLIGLLEKPAKFKFLTFCNNTIDVATAVLYDFANFSRH